MNSTLRIRVPVLVLAAVWLAARPAVSQTPSAADGPALLVERLETALARADVTAYRALFAATVPPEQGESLAAQAVIAGTTRAVVRERDRGPLPGMPAGEGYRLLVEVFIERGREAGIYTYRLDVRRIQGSDPPTVDEPGWRISQQELLTSVDGLQRLQLNPEKQFDVRNLIISAEDLEVRIPRGSAFVAEAQGGVTALVVLGAGEMRFSPWPEAERGQVRLFCGSETLVTTSTATFVRANPSDFDAHLSPGALVPAPVDQRELARARQVFDEEVGKSFGLDLRELSRESWSLVPGFGDFLAEIRTRKYQTLTYARSTGEAEDLTLFDRRRRRNISVYPSHRKFEVRGLFYNEDELADYDILDYDIEATFSPTREWIDAVARVKLRVRSYALGTLTLRLNEALTVRWVISEQQGRLLVIRVKGQNGFILNLPRALARGDILTLRVAYAGRVPQLPPDREVARVDALEQPLSDAPAIAPEPRFVFSNRSYWYPQAPTTDYATARLRLSVPARRERGSSPPETWADRSETDRASRMCQAPIGPTTNLRALASRPIISSGGPLKDSPLTCARSGRPLILVLSTSLPRFPRPCRPPIGAAEQPPWVKSTPPLSPRQRARQAADEPVLALDAVKEEPKPAVRGSPTSP